MSDDPKTGTSKYLTTDEAAAYLRYKNRSSLWRFVQAGRIKPDAQRGRIALWTTASLDRALQEGVFAGGPVEGPVEAAPAERKGPADDPWGIRQVFARVKRARQR
jgi:hypothetical protein